MARMRYPKQALELIREIDPDTSVSLNYIRALASSGKVPCIMIGRRHLLNVDALLQYLSDPVEHEEAPRSGMIRKLHV